jgi:HPt (histidine-containing phosphotransfer) domain-containing protein
MVGKAAKKNDLDDDLGDLFGDDGQDDFVDPSSIKVKKLKSPSQKEKASNEDDRMVVKSLSKDQAGKKSKSEDQRVVIKAGDKNPVENQKTEIKSADLEIAPDEVSTQEQAKDTSNQNDDDAAYEMLNDPEMKEIVIGFCDEALELFNELEEVLCELEDDPTSVENFEQYGQIIDRVMGAAKTVGAEHIAMYCELGKIIGYKASQATEESLLNVVVAILFDSNDILKKMVGQLKEGNHKLTERINTQAFGTRLRWLSDKFKHIDRASCSIKEEDDKMGQSDIDNLLAGLGL